MIDNRPISALSKGTSLGSSCPIIMKHDFPNESRNYIDDIFQQVSSTKKRFRYDRPQTASIQQGFSKHFFQDKQGQGRPQTAAVQNKSSTQLNSQELYSKLLQGKHQINEERFQIKPAKKLNTFQIHSALYKVKKQKEELDQKIKELEQVKSSFNETDFYLIANTGAMDYIFNLQKNNDIPIVLPEQQKKKQKPVSSIPRAVSAQSNKSRKSIKPDYLKEDSENRPQKDFEIIGNCCKMFKTQLFQTIVPGGEADWPQNVNADDPIKQQVENKASQMKNISQLLNTKNQNGQKKTDVLDDEEEIYDFVPMDFQSTKSSQQMKQAINNQYRQQYQGPQDQQQQLQYNSIGGQQNQDSLANSNQFTMSQHSQSQQVLKGGKIPYSEQEINRIRSAQSAKINYYNQQQIQIANLQNRPHTAHVRDGQIHALLSYGPVPIIKERITRNIDHFEILKQQKIQEQMKTVYEKKKAQFLKEQSSMSVSGIKIKVDNKNGQFQAINNLAMDQFQDFDLRLSQENQTIQSQSQQGANEMEAQYQNQLGNIYHLNRPQTAKSSNIKQVYHQAKNEQGVIPQMMMVYQNENNLPISIQQQQLMQQQMQMQIEDQQQQQLQEQQYQNQNRPNSSDPKFFYSSNARPKTAIKRNNFQINNQN